MSKFSQPLLQINVDGEIHPMDDRAKEILRKRHGAHHLLVATSDVVVARAANAAASGRCWICGEITKAGMLWDVVSMIAQSAWSGQLLVSDGEYQRTMVVERSTVIGAHSSAPEQRLGAVMYQFGALTAEQVEEVAAGLSPQQRFGEVAVAQGVVTQEKLFELLRRQAEEIVVSVMRISCGNFSFVEGEPDQALAVRLNLPLTPLLMEAVRRIDEGESFRRRIPSDQHVPIKRERATLAAGHEQATLYEAIDGMRSVEDLGRLLGHGPFETLRGLFQLLQVGVVAVLPPRPEDASAAVAVFNRTMQRLTGAADELDCGEQLREQLAIFATAASVYDPLFRGGGPASDGTVDALRVAQNLIAVTPSTEALTTLSDWLYEYASFAAFIVESLMRRDSRTPSVQGAPTSQHSIAREVAEMLHPLQRRPR